MLDTASLQNFFSRAAKTYDKAAITQQNMGKELLNYLPKEKKEKKVKFITDLGSGTGYFNSSLNQLYPDSEIINIDCTLGMLQQAKINNNKYTYLCADAQAIPLQDNSQDVIFSNAMIQWIKDFDKFSREINRILKPGGEFIFSYFAKGTLEELNQCWRAINKENHIINLPDENILNKFSNFKLEYIRKKIEINYHSVQDLFKELKQIGCNNAAGERQKFLMGKNLFNQLINYYEQNYSQHGKILASYSIILCKAVKRD